MGEGQGATVPAGTTMIEIEMIIGLAKTVGIGTHVGGGRRAKAIFGELTERFFIVLSTSISKQQIEPQCLHPGITITIITIITTTTITTRLDLMFRK